MRFIASVFLLLLCAPVYAAESGTRLLREPDVSSTHIVFVYAGDLWTATRSGAKPCRLTHTPEEESSPRFSPDGNLIAFERDNDIYTIPTAGGPERRLTWHPRYDTPVAWTPDGRHIVMHSDRWRGSLDVSPHLFLLPIAGGWPQPLPVPRATHASLASDGHRLAYTPVPEAVLYQPWRNYRGGALGYIAIYDTATKSYEELPRGNWNDVMPMWCGDAICFLSDRTGVMNLYQYSFASRATKPLTSYAEWDVRNPSATADGVVVYENGGWLYTLNLASGTRQQLSITLPVPTDQGRWLKSLDDVWRIYNDRAFRVAKNWSQIKPRYMELMKWATTWSDANEVLRQMLAEAGQSHMVLFHTGGGSSALGTGLLGADFRIEQGRYRFATIYRGDPNDEKLRGVLPDSVHEGDYLLAINGAEVTAAADLCSALVGLAGATVKLSISDSPRGERREVTGKPIENERALRYYAWQRRNADRVAATSSGRIGYLHIPDVDDTGVEKFRREWTALRRKVDAVIIDIRNNNGGTQPLDILDWIERPPVRMMFDRHGEVPPMIGPFLDGPKVMIANEQAASGGDELALYFKLYKLGPLVGTRTMGAMIGNAGIYEVSGGWRMAVPEFGFFWPRLNDWVPENRGVEPDYTVEWTPADLAAGRDPQLEKAIELARAALATYRKQAPPVPQH